MRSLFYGLITILFLGFSCGLADAGVWGAPHNGLVIVDNTRGSYSIFIWKNTNGFKYPRPTYEHETLIRDKRYAKPGGYWDSSLPGRYKDVGNSTDPVGNFTIGSLRAEEIRAETIYHTYYALSPENKNVKSSPVRINGQRGQRSCPNRWCVFGLDTEVLVDYTNLSAPGKASWTK